MGKIMDILSCTKNLKSKYIIFRIQHHMSKLLIAKLHYFFPSVQNYPQFALHVLGQGSLTCGLFATGLREWRASARTAPLAQAARHWRSQPHSH